LKGNEEEKEKTTQTKMRLLRSHFQAQSLPLLLSLFLIVTLITPICVAQTPDCTNLQMGQFYCNSPDIDPTTGEPKNCQADSTATGFPSLKTSLEPLR